jgi:hypothetical protein
VSSTLTQDYDTALTGGSGSQEDRISETAPDSFRKKPQRIEPTSWTNQPLDERSLIDEWSLNGTVPFDYPVEIEEKLDRLFRAAKDQIFEDGMESDFSKELILLVKKYGYFALGIITRLIVAEQVNAEVASEALRWIGHMDDPSSDLERLRLLERSLYCQSPRVRDGATLGLASMDDAHAVSHLKRAIARESYEELRKDFRQVLVQLENDH